MRTRRVGCTALDVTGGFFDRKKGQLPASPDLPGKRHSAGPALPAVMSLLFLLAVLLVLHVMASAADAATPDEQARAAEWRRRVHEPRREGFVLVKVGSVYQPMLRDYRPFKLPDTHMAFAPCTYMLPPERGQQYRKEVPKFVFRLDDGRFSYVRESAASEGDAHYALFDGYFIVDGNAELSEGQSMYLFRYGKDSVRLLDMIGAAPDQDFDFMSRYPGEPAYGRKTAEGE